MAKPKRTGLLDNIDMQTGQGSIPAKVVEMKPQDAPATKIKTVKSSLYLPPQAHRLLKEIAFTQDCKVHDLMIKGIDNVLASHGYDSVAELSKK